LPKIAIMMILQIWLANASLRDPSSMILDPENWDGLPRAIDSVVPSKKETPWVEESVPWT
jgi:hypothetical protein